MDYPFLFSRGTKMLEPLNSKHKLAGGKASTEDLSLKLADADLVGTREAGGAQAPPTRVEPMDADVGVELGAEGSAKAGTSDPLQEERRKRRRSGAAKKRARRIRQANQALSEQSSGDAATTGDSGSTQVGPHGPTASGPAGGRDTVGEGTEGRGPKRPRPTDPTPPEARKTVKKSRAGPKPTSFVDAVAADRKVAIVPSDYPAAVLKQEEGELLTRALLGALDAIPSGQAVPCFDGHRWEQGAMWVTCSDDTAKEWLKTTIPTLTPWEGASLQALEKDNLPRLKKTSAIFFNTKEDTEVLIRRLKRQNPTLNTDVWRVWDRREANGNVHLYLSVDAPSMEALARVGNAPHCGLGRARFGDSPNRTGGKAADNAKIAAPSDPGSKTGSKPAAGHAQATAVPSTAAPATRVGGACTPLLREPVLTLANLMAPAKASMPSAEKHPPSYWRKERGPTAGGSRGKTHGNSAVGPTPFRPVRGKRARGRPTLASAALRAGLAGREQGGQRTLDLAAPRTTESPPATDVRPADSARRGEEHDG